MSKKLRPVGDITDDMEKYLRELLIDHKMQKHEVLGMISFYIDSHTPERIERYTDGNIPIMIYSHPDFFKRNDIK